MSTDLFSVVGRRCLVTGAGSGIGEAIARLLAERGAVVVVNDIDDASAQRVCSEIGSEYVPDAIGDVTHPEIATRVVDSVISMHGGIDVLVNNAAAPIGLTRFLELDPAEWVVHLSAFHAALACIRAAAPSMIAAKWGRIVNITSISGVHGVDQMVLYGAGKGALHAFSAGLGKELADSGVTVNCVAPGLVDTPRQRSRPAEELAARRARVPMGRFADPREIAAAVVYLASAEAAYVTGEVLLVDGGRP